MINKIPNNFFLLKNLDTVILNDNSISYIPKSFCDMNLNLLNLNNNQIFDVGNCLKNIRYLYINTAGINREPFSEKFVNGAFDILYSIYDKF
jgi:Leucine-rich repeat (LRR) protein